MAITFLTAVSQVLVRAGEVPQDVGAVANFADSARSVKIQQVIQAWNEVILDISSIPACTFPKTAGRSTITLVDAQRYYDLPANFEQIMWPLTESQDGYLITEYPGGYERMIVDRCQPQLFVGIPEYAVIEPVDRKLLIDTTPDASAAGRVFTINYQKSLTLTTETDLFPFSDDAVRALYGAVAELYKYERQRIFDVRKYNAAKSTAIRLISPTAQDGRW